MDLNALQSTLAIAINGGIAAAERATGIPRSTLSRHLAGLERSLGVRLVERTSRRFRLTAEGEALVEQAGRPLDALAQIGERIRPDGGPLTGRLRISVPFLFGQTLLGGLAVSFAKAHPDVFLDVTIDDRHVDLLREGFDAALRVNPAPDSGMTGRLLGRNRLILVATPELVREVGYEGGRPDRITWPAVVRAGWGDGGSWEVEADDTVLTVPAAPRLSLSSPPAMLDAVLSGLGAAFLPRKMIAGHLEHGRLVSLGARSGAPDEIWIVHAAGRLPPRRLVAFMDMLAQLFER